MESEAERDSEARLQEEDERCLYRSENTEFKKKEGELQLLCSEQMQLVVVGQEWE